MMLVYAATNFKSSPTHLKRLLCSFPAEPHLHDASYLIIVTLGQGKCFRPVPAQSNRAEAVLSDARLQPWWYNAGGRWLAAGMLSVSPCCLVVQLPVSQVLLGHHCILWVIWLRR
jgi:hypothetical protein